MSYTADQLGKATLEIQAECHKTVENIKSNCKPEDFDYNDAANVFIFKKLAELQLRIQEMEAFLVI